MSENASISKVVNTSPQDGRATPQKIESIDTTSLVKRGTLETDARNPSTALDSYYKGRIVL